MFHHGCCLSFGNTQVICCVHTPCSGAGLGIPHQQPAWAWSWAARGTLARARLQPRPSSLCPVVLGAAQGPAAALLCCAHVWRAARVWGLSRATSLCPSGTGYTSRKEEKHLRPRCFLRQGNDRPNQPARPLTEKESRQRAQGSRDTPPSLALERRSLASWPPGSGILQTCSSSPRPRPHRQLARCVHSRNRQMKAATNSPA